MRLNLLPRFYYTLKTLVYVKGLWRRNQDTRSVFKVDADRRLYFFNHARTGLRMLLSGVGSKKLKVGIQAYTCHTVLQAIKKTGNEIVFLDVDNNFKLDLNSLKRKIEQLDALVITHTFGFPDDFDAIKKIAGNKIIIEDCAHSFLSKYNGKYTGTLGHASIFSMGIGKFPAIGSGGFCIVNQPEKFPLFEEEYARIPNSTPFSFVKSFCKVLSFSLLLKPPWYGMFTYGIGKRLDSKMDFGGKFSFSESKGNPWAEKIFNNNFSLFERMLNKQTDNARALASSLTIAPPVLTDKDANIPNYYAFPLLVKNRDMLYEKLLGNNIEPGKHFHKSLEWAQEFGYKKGECEGTEQLVTQILTVPVHYGISKKSIERIASIINENCTK